MVLGLIKWDQVAPRRTVQRIQRYPPRFLSFFVGDENPLHEED